MATFMVGFRQHAWIACAVAILLNGDQRITRGIAFGWEFSNIAVDNLVDNLVATMLGEAIDCDDCPLGWSIP